MGFEDLEIRLRQIFSALGLAPEDDLKARVKARTLARFAQGHRHQQYMRWRFWFARTLSVGALSALLLGTTGVVEMPLLGNQVVGQVQSQGGVVEIIRGKESVLVSGTEDLQVGDWVKVGHRGQAYITTDHFASDVQAGSALKLERSNTVFLDRGRLNTTHWQNSQVKTNRGGLKTGDGTEVAIEVSDTGETRILPSNQVVEVFDLNDGQVLAQAGESVVLRSDTVLSETVEGPTDLQLSNAQIEAILGKLAITRTKALTGIKNMLAGARDQGHQEILSAEQSYLSVVQILESNRDLTINRRINLDALAFEEVLPALHAKTDRSDLLTEAYALEAMFMVLSQNKNNIAFAPVDTGVAAYDRYVLLHYLAALGDENQAAAMHSLADTYVSSLLRKVQQSPIRIEQMAYLNQQVEALPRNDQSAQFLALLKDRLSPDLASALEEKINSTF